jgi:hypothetical protein
MPAFDNIHITKIWRHSNETDRIHYIISGPEWKRHLYTSDSSPLGRELAKALLERGYEGPKDTLPVVTV